jgi:anti-anti-sigma regulatory factor
MSFTMNKQTEGANMVVSLSGSVDEDANFAALDLGGATGVILDLEKVSAINSVGIREWIKWIKQIPSSAQISLRKCPKIIVDQINMVAGFLPAGAKIQSFFVPYFAESSGTEKMVLFENGKEFTDTGLGALPEIKDDSGEVMEMDVIEAKYFKFLKN